MSILFPAVIHLSTKKSRPLGELQKWASISYSRLPFSVQVIELERMDTIKLGPGFSDSSFWFRPERRPFGHRWQNNPRVLAKRLPRYDGGTCSQWHEETTPVQHYNWHPNFKSVVPVLNKIVRWYLVIGVYSSYCGNPEIYWVIHECLICNWACFC